MAGLGRREFWGLAIRNGYRWATDFTDHAARLVFVASLFGLSLVGAIIAGFRGGPVWLAPLVLAVFVLTALSEGCYLAWRNVPRPGVRAPDRPALRVSDALEPDTNAGCFRLRLWNDQSLPLELEWTHHPGRRAELGPQDAQGETVAVVCFTPYPPVPGAFLHAFLYGQAHQQLLGQVKDFAEAPLVVDISAYTPDFDGPPIRRRLTFTHDASAPLEFRTEVSASP